MLTTKQQENYKFFSDHLQEYLSNPLLKGKYAIICDCEIKTTFDSFESAYVAACAQYPIGDFIEQQIIDESETVEFLRSAVV